MNLDVMAEELHQTASEKGFWDPLERMEEQDRFIFYAKQLAMVHSEATEVLEALRKNKGQKEVVEEIADIIIRCLDLYWGMRKMGTVEDSLHQTFRRKTSFNKTREKLHGVAG